MAKTQNRGGEYRRMLLEQQGSRGNAPDTGESGGFFRIRFYICLCLFVCYLILDYTKASVYTLDSGRIYAEITRDVASELNLEETLAKVMDSVWVSEDEEP